MWFYLVSAVTAVLFYYINFVPLHLKGEPPKSKKAAINQARRLRKPGINIPSPFPNGWFAIAASSDIKPGTAKDINCLGENFVAFRSAVTQELYVLNAYCPHLGANLGIGGIVNDDCIKCPFHHWNFSGKDGSLVNIPYTDDKKSVEKFAKIKKWTSVEVNKIVFVWYHAENEEPWEIPRISAIENDELWLHGTNDFSIHCHIQDIPENGADWTHLNAVHSPNILAGADIIKFRDSLLSVGAHLWDANWSAHETFKHIANAKLKHAIQLSFLKFFHIDADIHQIGPGYVVLYLSTIFGKMVFLQTVTPVEPLKQKMMHYFYGSRFLGLLLKFSIYAETINVARDAMIWDNKTFVKNPLLPKEEKQIKNFRTWYSQFYSQNSKSFQEAHSDLSW